MRITVFTPTYNRSELLKNLYVTLYNQTCKDFEWLIVDDGSYDNTKEVVEEFKKNSDFPIVYIWKNNGGKHTALNLAFKKARGDFFVCVDSDDYLLPDAIEIMCVLSKKIENTNLAGFVGMCQDRQGKIIGKAPIENIISNTIDIRDVYGIQGEPEIYKTSILRDKEFPVFKGERFITEAILFDEITQKNKLLYTNVVLMVKDFQKGGLTANEPKIRVKNPIGTLTYYRQRYNISKTIKGKIKALVNYERFLLHSNNSKNKVPLNINQKTLGYILLPLAFIMYKIDKTKIKEKSDENN